MRKSWVTILLVLYIGYALLFYKRDQPSIPASQKNEEKIEDQGIIDKIKIYRPYFAILREILIWYYTKDHSLFFRVILLEVLGA
jgi:hypothetical protein